MSALQASASSPTSRTAATPARSSRPTDSRPSEMASLAGGAQERDPGRLPARGRRARRRAAARPTTTAASSSSTRRPRAAPACCAGSLDEPERARPPSRARRSSSATSTPTPARTCGRAPGAREDCEAACYDCLLSYAQPARPPLLDRHAIRDLLLALARRDGRGLADVAAPRRAPRAAARALCGSELERRWLDFLDEPRLRPADATPSGCIDGVRHAARLPLRRRSTSPSTSTGPPHDYPDAPASDDARSRDALEDAGYIVIRFQPTTRTGPAIVGSYPERLRRRDADAR